MALRSGCRSGWRTIGYLVMVLRVKNQEYWRQIADLLAQLRELGTTLTVYWVNGHSGNLGNDEVDRCATKGVICALRTTVKPLLSIAKPKATGITKPTITGCSSNLTGTLLRRLNAVTALLTAALSIDGWIPFEGRRLLHEA